MTFDYARSGGDLLFFVNFNDPATGQPFGQGAGASQVSAVAFRVLDPSTTPATVLLAATAGVWDSVMLQWKLAWTFGAALDAARAICIEAIPTRGGSVSAALWPEVRKLIDVSDIRKRTDDDANAIQAALADATYGLAALNTDLDSIIARLGLTTDTGGTSTAGTAQAKLNAILAVLGPSPGGIAIRLVP